MCNCGKGSKVNIRMSKCPQKVKRLQDLRQTANAKAIKTDNEEHRIMLLNISNSISTSLDKQYHCPSTEEINNIKYAIGRY